MSCAITNRLPSFQQTCERMDSFLENSRTIPGLSTITGITEAAASTIGLIGTIPAVAALKIAYFIPLPKTFHAKVTQLYTHALTASQFLLDRLARSIISAIPLAGNYLFAKLNDANSSSERLAEAQKRIQQLVENNQTIFQEKQGLTTANQQLLTECDSLNTQLDKALFDYCDERARLEKTNKELAKKVSELTEAMQGVEQSLQQEKESAKQLGEKVASSEATIKELQEQRSSLIARNEEATHKEQLLIEDMAKARTQIKALQEELTQLKSSSPDASEDKTKSKRHSRK